MQWIRNALLLVAALAVVSCASVQGNDDRQRAEGRVVGTITYESSLGEYRLGVISSELRPRLIRVGNSLWHPFVKMYDEDLKMRGEPFSMVLPAGDYRIAFWEVAQGEARSTSRQPIEIPFRVEEGAATYLGNLHFSPHWEVSLREEAARDLPILRSRFPELADEPIIAAIGAQADRQRVGGGYASVLMGRPFDPGHPFRLGPLQVNAPLSGGWVRLRSRGPTIVFARRGEAEGESQLAQVAILDWPAHGGRDDFIAAVRRRFEAEAPSDRFQPIESSVDFSDQRGYPCVRYRSASQDTQARVSATETGRLRLDIVSLVCIAPGAGGKAFSAAYSSRTVAGDPDFDAAADSFIQGVRPAGS